MNKRKWCVFWSHEEESDFCFFETKDDAEKYFNKCIEGFRSEARDEGEWLVTPTIFIGRLNMRADLQDVTPVVEEDYDPDYNPDDEYGDPYEEYSDMVIFVFPEEEE